MAPNLQNVNPISKLIKPPPHAELFRVLADSLNQSILVISSKRGTILAANHPFILLTGYARNELEALSASDLFSAEGGIGFLKQISDTKEPIELTFNEVDLIIHNGSRISVDVKAYNIDPAQSTCLLIIEPTETRLKQEEIRSQQEQRISLLVEISALLLEGSASAIPRVLQLSKDLLSADITGLYRVSPSGPMYILEGDLPDEFPTTLPADALDPMHRPILWERGTRPEHSIHKAARAADLSMIRTSPLGISTAWVGLLLAGWRNPTDAPADAQHLMEAIANLCHTGVYLGLQRAAVADLENDLAQLDQELRIHFDSANDAILYLDQSLVVLKANSAAGRMFGYSTEELRRLPIQDVLIGPSDLAVTLLDVIGHQRDAERENITIHRRDGRPFPVHLKAISLINKQQAKVMLLLQDRSEQKAIEDRTETLAQRALLGEVTAIFAHEVRNPINNISTGLQVISSRLGEDHPQHASLERIRNECTRLDRLMEDVLFFARPLELKMEPLNLEELLSKILARWKSRFELASIKYHTSFSPDTPYASADVRTLEQVITNIITNAVQAMVDGGTLSLSIAPEATEHGNAILLRIADTGPGIPQDQIDRIFDPFFTTKKDGTGLGLAISRRIMIAHQGSIQIESYPGAGSVFILTIPIAQDSETPEVE